MELDVIVPLRRFILQSTIEESFWISGKKFKTRDRSRGREMSLVHPLKKNLRLPTSALQGLGTKAK